ERGDERADLGRGEHLVEARALDVEDLAAEREDGLGAAVAALFGGATGRVALDDVDLADRGVFALAIGELARERARVERALALHHLSRAPRRLAGLGREDDLLEDLLVALRVLLDVLAEAVGEDALDVALYFARDVLVLGLRSVGGCW